MVYPHGSSPISHRLRRVLPPSSGNYDWQLQATVFDAIHPHKTGRVKFLGTWWKARCQQDILLRSNVTVHVVDRIGSTLIVEPIAEPDPLEIACVS